MADQLSPDDLAAVREAFEERAAIMEFDGGRSRKVAETLAESATKVFLAEVADSAEPGAKVKQVSIIAYGQTLEEVKRECLDRFGAARLRDVRAYGGEPWRAG